MSAKIFPMSQPARACLAQQMQLFDSENTLLELWNLAELFTAGRVTVPIDLVQRVVQVSEERTDS